MVLDFRPHLVRAKLGVEKVPETDTGEELFVVVYVKVDRRFRRGFVASRELTEDHAKHFVQDPKADLEAMFEIARQVFEEKARIGKARV